MSADHNEQGIRPDRLTATGEGMLLADFVAHTNSVQAGLKDAHVLALRLYTTVAHGRFKHASQKRRMAAPVLGERLWQARGLRQRSADSLKLQGTREQPKRGEWGELVKTHADGR